MEDDPPRSYCVQTSPPASEDLLVRVDIEDAVGTCGTQPVGSCRELISLDRLNPPRSLQDSCKNLAVGAKKSGHFSCKILQVSCDKI